MAPFRNPLFSVLQQQGVIGVIIVDADRHVVREQAGIVSRGVERAVVANATALWKGRRARRTVEAGMPHMKHDDVLFEGATQDPILRFGCANGASAYLYVALAHSVDVEISRRVLAEAASALLLLNN